MSAHVLAARQILAAESKPTQADDAAWWAQVLATLLKDNPALPVLIWSVYPSGLVGRAVGASDRHVTATVRAWARTFQVRAEVTSTPRHVARHRPGSADAWVLEPGEVKAEIGKSGFDVSVVGELVEVQPGVQR